MQTFLPHSDLAESASVLDSRRLNKQILEAYQILKVLSGASPSGAWKNHPAVLMWKNHEHALNEYAHIMADEATLRGIKTDKNLDNLKVLKKQYGSKWGTGFPNWFTDKNIMMLVTTTHKASLFDKDPMHYAHFGYAKHSIYNKPCCNSCKYYWVTHKEKHDSNR